MKREDDYCMECGKPHYKPETLEELREAVSDMLPMADVQFDNNMQIVIYTNLRLTKEASLPGSTDTKLVPWMDD